MKPIDKTALFDVLATQPPAVLLDILRRVYDQLDRHERQALFGQYIPKPPPAELRGDELMAEIEDFQRSSLAKRYYKPFAMNSKNWSYVPDETNEWFHRLGELLEASTQLTRQGNHAQAIACFGILFALIDRMENGSEIVFGDEIGSWMIPGNAKEFTAAYLESLAAVSDPQSFAAAAAPLIRRDSWHSFADQAYASAIRLANPAQRESLQAEIVRQKIKIPQ